MFGAPKIMNLAAELKKIPRHLLKDKALMCGGWHGTETSLSVLNPATGGHLIDISNCGAKETLSAIQSAKSAFGPWAAKTAKGMILTLTRQGASKYRY